MDLKDAGHWSFYKLACFHFYLDRPDTTLKLVSSTTPISSKQHDWQSQHCVLVLDPFRQERPGKRQRCRRGKYQKLSVSTVRALVRARRRPTIYTNQDTRYYYDDFRLAGEPVTFNLTVSIDYSYTGRYLGIYTLSSVFATDYAGNSANYAGANLTFTPAITVVK
jgi:hypothetical protein